ncbi:nitroreductase family protein [Bacillus dakarensis]|uniref:nitroreductase family protein n=1 Tax=Robertmurraya dakarensis TaxID=1926278 RepID=UPI000981B812|nr:nitroreductase family protein [Bacillus dakarensis]
MSVLEIIRSRREITSFENKKIPGELLENIVDAAYYSPSGNNLNSREFILVQNRSTLDYLEKTTPYMKWLSTAQAAVVVTGRPDISKYWLQDASIACGYVWLTATDLGLGVGFGAVYHSEDQEESENREKHVRKELGLPDDRRVVAILGLGYPAEKPKEKKLLKRNETIFFEKFRQ